MDRITKAQRSLLMARIRVKDTDIERILGGLVKRFWKKEKYRKNAKTLPGKPDIVFTASKIAVFADGDFWHGRNFKKWKRGIPDFWKKKIASNMERDKRQARELRRRGYEVLRIWGSTIKSHPDRVGIKISRCLRPKRGRRRGVLTAENTV